MLYFLSLIVQSSEDSKPFLISVSEGESSLEDATRYIPYYKENYYKVYSAWVDAFDNNNNKVSTWHECYVDNFGNVEKNS